MKKSHYYDKSYQETLDDLQVKKEIGLTEQEVKERKEKYGLNEFTPPKQKSFLIKLIGTLNDFLIIILLGAALLSIISNFINMFNGLETDFIESIAIIGAVMLSSSISLVMQGKAEKAFSALSSLGSNIKVKTIRNKKTTYISKNELTIGDIVLLETGDKVPADGRLLESHEMEVDESMLTGESITVKKDYSLILTEEDVPLAERKNLVFGGTNIKQGRGIMVVTHIGDNTEMGAIAGELSGNGIDRKTPLQEKLDKLGKTISIIGFIAAGIIFGLDMFRMIKTDTVSLLHIQNTFSRCVALIVAAVPEGLPTMIAITLALNMNKMAKLNALVKKMIACETIGSINVICSDKTGTLTENKMLVVDVHENGDFINKEEFSEESSLYLNFALNGTANIEIKDDKVNFIGNPTESALLSLLYKRGLDYANTRNIEKVLHQYAFSSDRKMMTTIIEKDDKALVLSKGAPERILSLCNKVLINGEIVEITEELKIKIEEDIISLQEDAKRVIGFAQKITDIVNWEKEQDIVETDLIFVGFVGIADPLREDVKSAVEKCRTAGIDLKILTGDNKITATAIAKELDLIKEGKIVLEAKDIDAMSDDELRAKLPQIVVIARSKPLTKMRVVEMLREMGSSVAVTGDGINDAPALDKADVGVAMGIAGTEVSKEAADIVLLDDSFSTIVNAVKSGRGIYENFQRFITFQLTVNVVAFATALLSEIFGFEMPFTTVQLLWVNIIMDGPPALMLGLESAREHLLDKKPVPRNANIITNDMKFRIATNGLFMVAMLIYVLVKNPFNVAENQLSTVVFTIFVLFQLFNVFNSREFGTDTIFKNLFSNKSLLLVIAITFVIQILVVQFGATMFKTVPLDLQTWGIVIAYSFSIIVFSEIIKLIRRIIKK